MSREKQVFVLDTNVLIHDPAAIYRFEEHDIYLPMVVLEELDNNKIGHSEVARNARQASRFLDELTRQVTPEAIKKGIPLNSRLHLKDQDNNTLPQSSGRLFFQTSMSDYHLPVSFPGHKNDNQILAMTLSLQQDENMPRVTLVSKDINLRLKAASIGVRVSDYQNDQALEDVNLLSSGYETYAESFWDTHSQDVESWVEEGRTYYKISGADVAKWYPNQFIDIQDGNEFEVMVRQIHQGDANTPASAVVEQIKTYHNDKHNVWGIKARNREQNYALNLLMDPDIDFVTLLGQAGTGKTLLTLASALSQVMDYKRYVDIIMTRATIAVGEDIGFLPGTEEQKMAPWMGALMDNLEYLTNNSEHSEWGKSVTQELLTNKIKIKSLNFMRGRTFLNRFIIIDEAQNLTSKQMKTLITRAGPGSKVVCLGNISQIDTPYLTETTSGLTYIVDRFKKWPHSGHITLKTGERSRLADFAANEL